MTAFSIGGNEITCPSRFEPDLASAMYRYLNGSPLFVGRPMVKVTWDFLKDSEVVLVRETFAALKNSLDLNQMDGTPINATIPDYLAGGLRTVSCYMTEPTGKAVGDGTQNFSVTFYNIHQTSFAGASPEGDLWKSVTEGGAIVIGQSHYEGTGWQF